MLLAAALAMTALGGGLSSAPALAAPHGAGGGQRGATVLGSTPANTPMMLSIVFKVRHPEQLTRRIAAVSTPGPLFRHYLTVAQFAAAYGRSRQTIDRLTQYLSQFGISSDVMANNLVVTAQGTAGAFDQAFRVRIQNQQRGGTKFHAPHGAPTIPDGMGGKVLAVLGLSNYGQAVSQLAAPVGMTQASPNASTPPAGMRTPADLVNQYNVGPLYRAGFTGQGQTIGIVTLAALNPTDAYTFWADNNISVLAHRLQIVSVDGGPGPVSLKSGSTETTVDVEQSGALAPQAHIIVYQAPNGGGTGFVDAYFTAVTQNVAGSVSSSWGTSETAVMKGIRLGLVSPGYPEAFSEAYMEGAVQGISMFAASGDAGAYAASRAPGGPKNLSVGMPSDSPYVTSAGGTTLPGTQTYTTKAGTFSVTVPQQRTWGRDYLFPFWQQFGFPSEAAWATLHAVGSGGGYSQLYSTPAYQRGVRGANAFSAVPWLTPIDSNTAWQFNPSPPVVVGTATGRNIPDLAMNADPQTGYAVYSTLFHSATHPSDWLQIGGTSFVAPQLAGITALINGQVGARVGFWNPQIYRFAAVSTSPFHPLDTTGIGNDNLYYTGTAGAIYNPGSGLGTPNIGALANQFAVEGASAPN